MRWLLLSPQVLLAIFAAITAALVALHLVRRQRREVRVPFLDLFVKDRNEARSLSFLSRRVLLLSLFLLLAIAASLTLAAGDPRVGDAPSSGVDVMVAVDISRSMGALEDGRSRLEHAKEEAREVLGSLGPGDRAAIVAFGEGPEMRSPLTEDRSTLLRAIDSLSVEDVHEDIHSMVSLANELLVDARSPVLVVLGDGASVGDTGISTLDEKIELRPTTFGGASENLGIVSFAARRYRRDPSQAELRIVFKNAGSRPRRAELVLESDGRALEVRSVELGPHETREESVPQIGGAEASFMARIRATDGIVDALPSDDIAYTTLPARRALRLLLVSARDLFLEAALGLDERVTLERITPREYVGTEGFDLAIYDAFLPNSPPSIPALYFVPQASSNGAGASGNADASRNSVPRELRRELLAPRVTRVLRDDSLLRGLALEELSITRARELVSNRGDVVLLATGSSPLLLRGEQGSQPFLAFAFDLRDTDLPLRMGFPVLIVRAIEELVGSAEDFELAYRTDGIARIPASSESGRVKIREPDGAETAVSVVDGTALYRPRLVGLHTIMDDTGERSFAASIGPADESNIESHPYSRGSIALESSMFRGAGEESRPWHWLIAFAALLLCIEWVGYHRRWSA